MRMEFRVHASRVSHKIFVSGSGVESFGGWHEVTRRVPQLMLA